MSTRISVFILGGVIGADHVARAAPDGYTLLFASSSVLSINPHISAKSPYDPVRSFSPVILIGHAPNMLIVQPSVPAKSVKQLIALAFASNGTGTLSHLTAELYMQRAGVRMLHAPAARACWRHAGRARRVSQGGLREEGQSRVRRGHREEVITLACRSTS